MNDKMSTYMVIEYQGRRGLVAKKEGYPPNRLHWFGGISYMTMGPGVTVLHTFEPTNDIDREDEIEIAFWRDWNPPLTGGPAPHGWLAPDGTFYPCMYSEHESVANQIAAARYNTLRGSQCLDERHWLRIQNGTVVVSSSTYPPATQAQVDLLWDIARLDVLTDRERRFANEYLSDVELIEVN